MLGFYEKSIIELEAVIKEITARLETIRKYRKINNARDPIEYIKTRIKSEESMKEKLKRKGLEVNLENSLNKIYDAAGIRIICTFADDVYDVVQMIRKYDDIEIIKEKDYIKNPDRKKSQDEFKQRIWTNEQKSDNILPMYMTYLQEKFRALNANVKINDINGYNLEYGGSQYEENIFNNRSNNFNSNNSCIKYNQK